MIVMIAPPHKRDGKQRLDVSPEQARILKALGWTEEDPPKAQEIGPAPLVNEQNFFRDPPEKPKRKYERRNMDTDKPKRRYQRRDMVPESDE